MKAKLLVGFLLTLALVLFLAGSVHDYRMQLGFAAIAPRATEDAIRQSLGSPSTVDSSCKAYGTEVAQTCDHVLVYKSAFHPLKPAYWLIFIDASGHAVATSRQARP